MPKEEKIKKFRLSLFLLIVINGHRIECNLFSCPRKNFKSKTVIVPSEEFNRENLYAQTKPLQINARAILREVASNITRT